MPTAVSKAPHDYWDQLWKGDTTEALKPFDPHRRDGRWPYMRARHRLFCAVLRDRVAPGSRLIEVGCGNSHYLPYFAHEHGLEVSGLDYSEAGCIGARAILESAGVPGTIYCNDMFAPPAEAIGRADIAVSFGVVEHFEDTTAAVAALARLVRPGGYVLTLIPNLRGVPGRLLKAGDRRVWDMHVPLSLPELATAHRETGLDVEAAGYIVPVHFGICRPSGESRTAWRSAAYGVLAAASHAVLWFATLIPVPATRALSETIYTLAHKPAEDPPPAR